jgi:hypothetical protein
LAPSQASMKPAPIQAQTGRPTNPIAAMPQPRCRGHFGVSESIFDNKWRNTERTGVTQRGSRTRFLSFS